MTETNHDEEVTAITPMSVRDLMMVAGVGALTGIVVWGTYQLMMSFVTPLLFCQDDSASICTAAPAIMDGIGLLVGGVVGLLGLIRLRTFRPLLIVLAGILSFSSMAQQLSVMSWYWAALLAVLLFSLGYALYAWIARLRVFWLTAVIVIVLGVIIRLVLFS